MPTDLRLALRHLAKARSFTLIAVLTLAVGIGASTAMFSALRALVVVPFDYPAADRVVQVWSGDRWPLSAPDFRDLHAEMTSFAAFGVYKPSSFNLGSKQAEVVNGVNATAGVLAAYGVAPVRGRWLQPADEVNGAPPVAVISHHLWQRSFGGDPDLVGKTARINGADATVVGIMPEHFEFAAPWMRASTCELWLPLQFKPDDPGRDSHWLCGVARLRDGVTLAAADAEAKTIGRRLTQLYPNSNTAKKFLVRSLHFEMTREVGSQVWLLFGAVALVLLVACANVASMLLARGAQRQGEFAVRVALGGTRRDLLRLALTESLLLAIFGSLLGLVVAVGAIEGLRTIAPATEARQAAIRLDAPVLLFALGATFLTALLAGLPPALLAMRTTVAGVIREDARGAVGSRSRHRMLRGLIIAQVAVAFLLANGAALFSAGYLRLLEANRQLDTELVLSAQINLRGPKYETEEQRLQFWARLEERLRPLPGVGAVGLTSKLPLEGGSNTSALINDEVFDPTIRRISIERSSVTFDYFDAMGLTLLQGRRLTAADGEGKITGIVINRAFAERAWPGQSPIGEIIRSNQPEDPWYTSRVVGVVEDVRQWGAEHDVQPEMYTTPKGHWDNRVYVILRSSRPAAALAPLLRREVAALDRELAPEGIRTLREVVRESTEQPRAVASLVDLFMLIALGLVGVGLYGTLSYHVLQRTREIGVRLAIGALRRDIIHLVLGQGGRWVALGLALGAAAALALSSVLRSLVYGMEGISPLPLLLAGVIVGTAGLAACWLPARKAAALDPLVALRAD